MKSSAPESVGRARVRAGALRRFTAGLIVAFALVGCAAVGAADDTAKKAPATPVMMDDPLLGLSYDTTKVRFERLPEAIAKKADLGAQQWIYARSDAGGATLYVVSGFLRVESDDPAHPGFSMEPDFGAVLKSKDGKVEVLGVPDRLYGDDAIVSAQELKPLLADAVVRYVKAWGSKEALQKELRGFDDPSVVPVSLREALQVQDLHVGAAGGAR